MLFILTTVPSIFSSFFPVLTFRFCSRSVTLCLYHSRINLCLYSSSFGVFFCFFPNLPSSICTVCSLLVLLTFSVVVVVVVIVVVTASAVTVSVVAIGSAQDGPHKVLFRRTTWQNMA